MKKNRIGIFISLILIVFNLLFLSSFEFRKVNADTGPKPTAEILFENVSFENVDAGFLFNQERSTQFTGKTFEQCGYVGEIDEYKYVYHVTSFHNKKTLKINWSYNCPSDFKVFLYDKDTKTMYTSSIIQKEAYQAHYTIDCSNIKDKNLELIPQESLGKEIGFAILRIAVTLAIEIVIALCFKFTKKSYITIVITNIVTQILLNVFLIIYGNIKVLVLFSAFLFFPISLLALLLGEVLIFGIEGLVYRFFTWGKNGKRGEKAYLYSFLANLASLVIGLVLYLLI